MPPVYFPARVALPAGGCVVYGLRGWPSYRLWIVSYAENVMALEPDPWTFLPEYHSPTRGTVRAGLIKALRGPSLEVSTAPRSVTAARAQGHPHVPITLSDAWKAENPHEPGRVLVIHADHVETMLSLAFDLEFTMTAEGIRVT